MQTQCATLGRLLAPGHANRRVPQRLGPSLARPAAAPRRVRLPPRCAAAVESEPAPKKKEPEVDHIGLLFNAIQDPKKVVVVQTAPAVRVSIGEEMGLEPGQITTGKLVAGLKALGFDYVFDTLVAADLTIMEEGFELINRLKGKLEGSSEGPLPMFTSCCPGWIALVEQSYPEMIPHVSSCKSPQMMMGAVLKAYFSKKVGVSERDLTVVSVMPCVRKQGEADRIMMQTPTGAREVDHVLTTRDLGEILRDRGIDFDSLPDTPYDTFMDVGSGAAAIFGTTGGVMEAALRTVYEVATGERMAKLELEEVRGLDGVREATVTITPHQDGPLKNMQPVDVHVAVANGLGNAKKVLEEVRSGRKNYEFIEVMACPGGCVGGGGQPRSKDKEILKKRQMALYNVDERSTIRRSYENPVVQHLYEAFLGEPASHEAHKLLHTYYVPGTPEKYDITKEPEPEEIRPYASCEIIDGPLDEELLAELAKRPLCELSGTCDFDDETGVYIPYTLEDAERDASAGTAGKQ